MEKLIKNTIFKLVKEDITSLPAQAIVNAANSHLILGGGVAGAIKIKGGPSIQKECNKIGRTPVGKAVITRAGNLKAKYIIHAVGPRMGEGEEDNKLKNATLNSLKIADKNNIKEIAFPAISTGIFGYPTDKCAKIMINSSIEYIKKEDTKIEKIIFCLYDNKTYNIFKEVLISF